MNYLAHFLLSFDDADLLAGQFMADDVKGKKYLPYEPRIRQGILLHRFVDEFTDTHPACLQLRSQIRSELGLFSPVAMDVFFDHILASEWTRYHPAPLTSFISTVYERLESRIHVLTPHTRFLFEKMKQYNWLEMYAHRDSTGQILMQMSGRIKGGQPLKRAPEVLENQIHSIKRTFDLFFPELIDRTQTKLDTFANLLP